MQFHNEDHGSALLQFHTRVARQFALGEATVLLIAHIGGAVMLVLVALARAVAPPHATVVWWRAVSTVRIAALFAAVGAVMHVHHDARAHFADTHGLIGAGSIVVALVGPPLWDVVFADQRVRTVAVVLGLVQAGLGLYKVGSLLVVSCYYCLVQMPY